MSNLWHSLNDPDGCNFQLSKAHVALGSGNAYSFRREICARQSGRAIGEAYPLFCSTSRWLHDHVTSHGAPSLTAESEDEVVQAVERIIIAGERVDMCRYQIALLCASLSQMAVGSSRF